MPTELKVGANIEAPKNIENAAGALNERPELNLEKPEKVEEKNGSITAQIISHQENEKEEHSEPAGGFCAACGTQMVKKGNCKEQCPKCGWENPKGCGE